MAQRWFDGWFVALVVTLNLIGFCPPLLPLVILIEMISDGQPLLNEGGPSWWLIIPVLFLSVIWGPHCLSMGIDFPACTREGSTGTTRIDGMSGRHRGMGD